MFRPAGLARAARSGLKRGRPPTAAPPHCHGPAPLAPLGRRPSFSPRPHQSRGSRGFAHAALSADNDVDEGRDDRYEPLTVSAVDIAPSTAALVAAATSSTATSSTAHEPVVTLTWSDGTRSSFHPMWLRDNCASNFQPDTGQKTTYVRDLYGKTDLLAAQASPCGTTLEVVWDEVTDGADGADGADGQGQVGGDAADAADIVDVASLLPPTASPGRGLHRSSFCARHLSAYGCPEPRVSGAQDSAGGVSPSSSSTSSSASSAPVRRAPTNISASLVEDALTYEEVVDTDAGRWDMLRQIAHNGVALVRGVRRR